MRQADVQGNTTPAAEARSSPGKKLWFTFEGAEGKKRHHGVRREIT